MTVDIKSNTDSSTMLSLSLQLSPGVQISHSVLKPKQPSTSISHIVANSTHLLYPSVALSKHHQIHFAAKLKKTGPHRGKKTNVAGGSKVKVEVCQVQNGVSPFCCQEQDVVLM